MVTIKEIAKCADVSVGTVDRVIHNRGRVSKETAKKIQEIIKSLNYKPNIFARSLSLLKEFHFGVMLPYVSEDNHYWELTIKGIERARCELEMHKIGIKYYHYEGYSEKSFEEIGQKVINDNLSGLLIGPIIYSSVNEDFVRKIPSNLPYVFFNSNIPNSKEISYIGQDSFQSGVLAAQLMNKVVSGPGTIAILTMLHDDYHIKSRVQGFQSYFDTNNKLKIKIYGAHRTEDKSTLDKVIDKVFSENTDLQGIFVATATSFRVAEHILKFEKTRKIKVIGYDLTDENIKYLAMDYIDFLIGQRPEIQGYQGIYTLYKHIVLKEKIEQKIMMPLDIITRANINYYQMYYLGD